MPMTENVLKKAKRIVLKIGSSLLVDEDTGCLKSTWLNALADDVAAAHKKGREVIIVTSGASALGRKALGMKSGKLPLPEKQAAAAVGQIRLSRAYQEIFAERGLRVAQMLLAIDDFENRKRYLNASHTLHTLLAMGVVPVINENDAVATSEFKVGDNDRLSARVAQMASADALVLFSDIKGLYTADPRKNPDATLIKTVKKMTPEIEAMAGVAGSSVGTGGMVTKLMAARICMEAGCAMAIALGKVMYPLSALEKSGECTWFLPSTTPVRARKAWIAASFKTKGTLVLDAGAVKALESGKSLLPAGVKRIEGVFERGDAVALADESGVLLGRGLTTYSSYEAAQIAGHHSRDIEKLLGYHGAQEIVHRDNLVTEKDRG